MVRKERLDPKDKEILRFLYNEGCPCSVQEIAESNNINWVSVKNHLSKLKTYGFVLKVNRPNKIMWQFNYKRQK